MASTDKPASSPPKAEPELESGKAASLPKTEVPTEVPPPPPPAGGGDYYFVDVALRISVFSTTLVAVLVMVTSNQTELVPFPANPRFRVPVKAKFTNSPAFIYFIAALSVACLYSIITTLASFSVILKPVYRAKFLLHFALLDVLVLGLVASATGTAGGVAYIGLRGNSHVNWGKICNVYDTFCQQIGSSIAISLFASILLVFLVSLSIYSLHSKISRS